MSAARIIGFGMGRSPKYHNKVTVQNIDGKQEKFASKKEADVFNNLRFLQASNRVRNLQRQVPYRIEVNGKLICKYIADFVFEEYAGGVWKPIVADAKGFPTPTWKLKKKMMLAILGIDVREY